MRAIVDDPIPHPSEMAPTSRRSSTRSSCARCASGEDARFASAHEMAVALERFALSQRRASARCRSPATRSRCSPPSICSGGRPRRRRWTWRSRSRRGEPAPMAGLGAEPPTAGPTMALRPGVSWSDGRSELRSASGRSRSRSSPQPGPRAAPRQPERAQSIARRPAPAAATGRRRAAKRDRTWVYGGRRRAAGHRRRRRLDADAPPGDLGAGPPAPAAPAARGRRRVDDRHARRRRRPRRQPAVARTPAPTAGRRAGDRARRAGRAAGRDPGRPRRPRADSASWKRCPRPAKSKPSGGHSRAPRPARRPKRPTTRRQGRRRATAEARKADPFAD